MPPHGCYLQSPCRHWSLQSLLQSVTHPKGAELATGCVTTFFGLLLISHEILDGYRLLLGGALVALVLLLQLNSDGFWGIYEY